MKRLFTLLLLVVSMQLSAQSYPIVPIIIVLPSNPDAITANWGGSGSMLTITASTKPINGRIDGRVIESRILVNIKSRDSTICGSYVANSAPLSNFNAVTKVWSGNNAVALLGKGCALPPGDYEICVQFFGNDAKGVFPLSEEKRKSFSIAVKERPTIQPPQTSASVNGTSTRETDPKRQVTTSTTIVDPKPQVTVTYDCGKWGPLVVNNREKYYPDSKINANCNRPFQFTTSYQCSSSDQSCQTGTTWQITKDGVMIKNNTGNKSISEAFTPTGNGIYTITLNAVCNNKSCTPVTYTIVVSDCGGGGGGVVNSGGSGVKCDCGAWGNLIVNNREQYKSDSRIIANCNQPFQFSTTYQCSPSDLSCQAATNWQVTKDGVMIKSNNGNKSISEAFTPIEK